MCVIRLELEFALAPVNQLAMYVTDPFPELY